MLGRTSSKTAPEDQGTLESHLHQVALGDREAFDEVYRQLAAPILGVAPQGRTRPGPG